MKNRIRMGLAALVAAGAVAALAGLHRVPPGTIEVAVIDGGTPTGEIGPGLHWRVPGAGHSVRLPTEPDTLIFPGPETAGTYRLFDASGNEIGSRFAVAYHVDPGHGEAVARALLRGRTSGVLPADGGLADTLRARLRARARAVASGFDADGLGSPGGRDRLARALAQAIAFPGVAVTAAPLAGGAGGGTGVNVLMIGVDAGDWKLIDPLVAAGKMPAVASLLARGTRYDYHTLTPMLSPLLWTSIATGTTPDRHGILDFLTADPATGKMIPVTSSLRREPAFWNVLTQYGVTQDIVAWLATWPAETVTGHLVTDRFGYLAFAGGSGTGDDGMTYPPEYVDRARELEVHAGDLPASFWKRFMNVPDADLDRIGAAGFEKGNVVGNVALTVAQALTSTKIAEDLQRTDRPRLLAVYYELIDAMGHLCMPYAPPRQPQISPGDYERYSRAENAAYVLQDEQIAALTRGIDPARTVVIVLSDHGMKSGSDRPSGSAEIEGGEAARWHRDPGILLLAGPGIREHAALSDSTTVLDVAPTVLALLGLPVPRTLQGRVLTEAFTPEGAARYRPAYVDSIRFRPEVWTPPAVHGAPHAGPAQAALHNNLGLVKASEGKRDEAEAEYRKALEAVPGDVNARTNLANVLMDENRLPEALDILEKLHRDVPDRVPPAYNLGVLYQRMDRLPDAERTFREVLAVEPRNVKAQVDLGHTLLREGKLDEAKGLFEKVIASNPSEANAHFGLGLVDAQRGDLAGAKAEFRMTLEIDPHHRSAAENLKRLQAAGG